MKKAYIHLSSFWKYYQIRRYAAKVLPLVQKIMHLRLNSTPVNILDYLHLDYYMFNDDFQFVKHNGWGHWMIALGKSNELLFFRRDFMGTWYLVQFHDDQLLKVLGHKLALLGLAKKFKKIVMS